MLSRVAERVYWMGRYMERCENVARLVDVNTKLLLDLPRGVSVGWGTLVDISGGSDFYRRDLDSADERAVMRFLLADMNNPSSLMSSITYARENARITREILPSEVYTLVNDLYLYLKDRFPKGAARGERQALLEEVIEKVQQFTGMLAGCMSHNDAYSFLRLGRNLERADMTSRIVDVGTSRILTKALEETEANEPFENILWMSVLRSLSGYQMYRQHVLDRVNAEDVVMFLVQDSLFPRSVAHCLSELSEAFDRLPNSDNAQRVLASVRRQLKTADILQLIESGLHEYIDSIQSSIGEVHSEIADTWFLPQVQVTQ
ncbi:alpha-E domain-containing protein [Gilvimarinus sp. SDUM040013]|uniref:Alpha-E domain-containing protein n=1 Tax=Gilvimarinus gilvus TaxID=3058038 RepID=A0ABU4RW19_9GAMM|nr:alpha-E domain-containing protein [Gilvimarinus sp. SDUM040013]MDO3386496.1 alpha-E domain-containing protein [Gilvimarinus sp. SDUM040013]MDX6849072.1 alpha-E domain-containing protein [Gilvimarinus sp. SDUM040013]